MMASEALVASPLEHGRYLHSSGKGSVTVAQKIDDRFHPRSYGTQELNDVLPAYGGVQDAYISLNRFWGSRKNANVAQLCALYSDLDYHKVPGLSDRHPLGVVELAFEALEGAKVPRPSLAVATGRGLALYWVFYEPVPGAVEKGASSANKKGNMSILLYGWR